MKNKIEIWKAENLKFMFLRKDKEFRFIYIDPPFNTRRKQKIDRAEQFQFETSGNYWPKKVVGYHDSYGDGILGYLEYMKPRLEHCHRLLDDKGVLCVHLDYNAVHYVKCLLDEIFGYGDKDKGHRNHFLNEIVWRKKAKNGGKKFAPSHQIILIYRKTKDYIWNPPPKEKSYGKKGGGQGGKVKYFDEFCCKDKCHKKPLRHYSEVNARDIFEHSEVSTTNKLYPTEKPAPLIKTLMEAFTNKGDKVADFFCGCGSTIEASYDLGRSFVGCDAQEDAMIAIKKKLSRLGIKNNNNVIFENFEKIPKNLYKLSDRQFQTECIIKAEGTPNPYTSNDGGIDGIRVKDGALMQVKKSNGSIKHIRELLGVMVAKRKKIGVLIAKQFPKSVQTFSNSITKDGYVIELQEVDYVLKMSKSKSSVKKSQSKKVSKSKLEQLDRKQRKIAGKHSHKKKNYN